MPDSVETRLRLKAESLGFTLFGVAPATDADGFGRFTDWLDAGYAGEMSYLHKYRDHRRHPKSVRPWVKSVVMLGWEYGMGSGFVPPSPGGRGEGELVAPTPSPLPPGEGGTSEDINPLKAKVAKYAHAPDYHRVLWDAVNELAAWLRAEVPGCRAHGVADTAPILERDFARRAGLGWFGKNAMLINKHRGSFFLLAAFLTDIELTPSRPHDATHCGTCTACLDACPTQAFPAPGVLDARKCVSYLTIELRGSIPEELRTGVGGWLFGCDVCQDVCPWNRRRNAEPSDVLALDPAELLGLSPADFKKRFEGTALLRARRTGLLRNAAIVLGNTGDVSAIPALERAARDADEVIREAALWAISRIQERCV